MKKKFKKYFAELNRKGVLIHQFTNIEWNIDEFRSEAKSMLILRIIPGERQPTTAYTIHLSAVQIYYYQQDIEALRKQCLYYAEKSAGIKWLEILNNCK